MSRGPLEWLAELREQAERRAVDALAASRAGLERARARRDGALVEEGLPAAAGALAQAARHQGWLAREVARRGREVEEARTGALRARASAEQLRRLLAGRREARRGLSRRREELEAAEPGPGARR